MKILFKDGNYTKVSDVLEADKKVRLFGYRYASRSEWKTNVRDAERAALAEALKAKAEEKEKQKKEKSKKKNEKRKV